MSEHLSMKKVFFAVIWIIVCLERLMMQSMIFNPIVDRALCRKRKKKTKEFVIKLVETHNSMWWRHLWPFNRNNMRNNKWIFIHRSQQRTCVNNGSTVRSVVGTVNLFVSEIWYDEVEINSLQMDYYRRNIKFSFFFFFFLCVPEYERHVFILFSFFFTSFFVVEKSIRIDDNSTNEFHRVIEFKSNWIEK